MKALNMKKTPSALKWLAEKRARVAGELVSSNQICDIINEDIAALNQELSKLDELRVVAESQRDVILANLAALDSTVTLYDANIKPSSIEPIHAWQGRYETRGSLRDFLVKTLQDRAPEFVTTTELTTLAMVTFSLVFTHPSQRRAWYKNSLRGALKVLASQGHLERTQDPSVCSGVVGSWRWKDTSTQPTLAELRVVGVTHSG